MEKASPFRCIYVCNFKFLTKLKGSRTVEGKMNKILDYKLEFSSAISLFLSRINPKSLHLPFLYFTVKKYKKSLHTLAHLSCNPHTLDCCRADLFLQGKKTPLSRNCKLKGKMKGAGYIGYSVQNCGSAQYGRKCGLTKR